MMLKTIIALALIVTIHKVSADNEKGIQACRDLFNPENWKNDCCDIDYKMMPSNETAKQLNCPRPMPGEEWTCAHAECPLKSLGFLDDDGKLNYDAIKKQADEHFEKYPNPELQYISNEVNKECTEENLNALPYNMCPAQKYEACVMLVFMSGCTKWKMDNEVCQKMSENSKLCKESMKNMEK